MIAELINRIVKILTGGKYLYINEKEVKPFIVVEKMNSFDVDSIIDFDACAELYATNKGDEK